MSEPTAEIIKCLKVLELSEKATLAEIKKTYHHLKSLYASESPIIDAATEFREDLSNSDILDKIETAYTVLVDFYEHEKREKTESHKSRVEKNQIPEFECYNGDALRITREVMGITLHEIAFSSKIPVKLLEYIEEEAFTKLPPAAYIRAYVKTYARYLSLDEQRVVEDYFKTRSAGTKIIF